MKEKYDVLRIAMVAILAVFLGFSPKAAFSQENVPPVFALVEFMKPTPQNEGKYVELEQNVWKKLHQARVDKGIIVGWYLYRVHYTAANDPYNYVTVTLFSDPLKMENPWQGIDVSSVLNGMNVDKVYEETLNSRELVSSNLMNRIDFVYPEGGPGDFKYLQLDYMKVKQGMDGDYIDTEVNLWKSIHKEFIKAGSRVGWSLWGRNFPSGYGLDFQYVTVNYFSDFSKIGTANYQDAYEKANLGMSVSEISEKTNKARLLVKSELWEVVDHTEAQ
jgi:hypothetical protein